MNTNNLLWLSLIPLLFLFTAGWWRQLHSQNAGWVDVLWAFSVAILSSIYCLLGQGDATFRLFIALIYGIWFLRLGWYLSQRLLSDEKEDGRYRKLRDWAGPRASLVFLFFYSMQASWVWLFSFPAWLLAQGYWPAPFFLFSALIILVLSLVGESVADYQLSQFKLNPENQGKTCNQGLWRYSRHPNYFFEWCHWFAYPLLGMGTASGQWLWLWPVLMFLFLRYMTGIPFTEQQALRSRGLSYQQYQATTPLFFPWFPKSTKGEIP